MAENESQVSATGILSTKKDRFDNDLNKNRDVLNKNSSRIRSRLSKSSRRRAGTPEPEEKVYTDDSEKDISDRDNFSKSRESVSVVSNDSKERQNAAVRRFISRRNKHDTQRSKSLERILPQELESEDDFETIRQMHKSKELEEEKKEATKFIEDSKVKEVEKLKQYVPKPLPSLIEAPKDLKKRKRHKSLPLQELNSETEVIKTSFLPSKPLVIKRKSSTSEDEDKNFSSNTETNFQKIDRLTPRKNSSSKLEKNADDAGNDSNKEKTTKNLIMEKKPWFFKQWFSGIKQKTNEVSSPYTKKEEANEIKMKPAKESKEDPEAKKDLKTGWLITEILSEWKAHIRENEKYYDSCLKLKNRCLSDLLILIFFCGCGGLIFRFTEGAFESFYKCGVKRVKRDFIDTLWKYSQYMLEEDWKSHARKRLMEFENQLHSAHEAGMTSYSGQKSWSFLNAIVYCLTVVTTIGYGHISPSTTTGRAITIIYAIFGIPMFLILLADFGKLFTRGIKFLWAFVRRLYYTGSCRRVRKTAPVQEMMKGVQIMYDFAKTRKFSTVGLEKQTNHLRPPEMNIQGIPETPGTPNWSNYEIDDEFNLPISVAISILLIYIFLGAFLYWMWEDWSFFESFYFVFISMSTIGFGDFVPQHPMYMMLSIVYLVFGLALTSMCINVVQEKLSDTFKQASVKLGTTIGLKVEENAPIPQSAITTEQSNPEQMQ